MTETWVPGAVVEPGPYQAGAHGGPVSAHLGVIEHVQVGVGDLQRYFSNLAAQASSHGWVPKVGPLVQYLPLEVASWAQAAGNYSYVSFETEGVPEDALTDNQVLNLAHAYRFIEGHAQLGGFGFHLAEAPGQPGLGWHGMGGVAWGNHPGCPGDRRKAQRAAVLYLAAGAPNAPSSDVVAPVFNPVLPGGYVDWQLTGAFPAGAWLLRQDGAVFTLGGARYPGGLNTVAAFNGRSAARFDALTPSEQLAGKLAAVYATSGERYAVPS